MVMRIMREGAFAGFLKYFLFSILAMSILGLVLMDVSGAFSGNISGNRDVAVIEDKAITLVDFDRSLRRTLESMGITPQQAFQMGYTEEILAREIRGYLAMVEAEKTGIEISNEQIKKSIASAVKPIVQEGQTLQQAFEQALQERGMSEKDFVKGIKKELTSDMMVKTVEAGFFASTDWLAEDILAFQSQTRDVDVVVFPDNDITESTEPADEQLRQLYESYKNARFKIPEYRTLKIGIYEPDPNAVPVVITDAEAKDFYNQNTVNFQVAEQKIITQVLLNDEAAAQKIIDISRGGKTLEDAFQEVMGKDAAGLTPNMHLETTMMFPEMRDLLEKATQGSVSGPLKTPLGFHVIRLDGTIPPMTRPFDEVKEPLKKQMADEAESQKLYDISTALEENFMQGGTIEDAKSIAKLKALDLPVLEMTGLGMDGKDAFAGQDEKIMAAKASILKTAFEILPDDIDKTRMVQTPDGSLMVVEMVGTVAESYKPYDSVRQDIIIQFQNDQKASANRERVATFLKDLKDGKTTLESLASAHKQKVQKIDGITVSETVPAPLTDEVRPALFKEAVGGYVDFRTNDGIALIHVRGFKINPASADRQAEIEGIMAKLQEEMKTEAVIMYLEALSNKYEARVNDGLLQRAYGENAPQAAGSF